MLSREYLLHARTVLWLERVPLEEGKKQRVAKYHLQRQQQLQLRRQLQQESAAHEASRAAAEERRDPARGRQKFRQGGAGKGRGTWVRMRWLVAKFEVPGDESGRRKERQ